MWVTAHQPADFSVEHAKRLVKGKITATLSLDSRQIHHVKFHVDIYGAVLAVAFTAAGIVLTVIWTAIPALLCLAAMALVECCVYAPLATGSSAGATSGQRAVIFCDTNYGVATASNNEIRNISVADVRSMPTGLA